MNAFYAAETLAMTCMLSFPLCDLLLHHTYQVGAISSGCLGSPLLCQPTQLLRRGAERPRIRALQHRLPVHSDLLALLEEQERGHGGDAVLGGHPADVVDIDLGKGQLARDGVLVGELGEDGGNLAAGRAPVGEEVDGDVGRGGEEGLEVGGGVDVVDLVVARHDCWCLICLYSFLIEPVLFAS